MPARPTCCSAACRWATSRSSRRARRRTATARCCGRTRAAARLALYPNLTTTDPVWRALNRDVRYRRALSLAIDRRTLNNALLFGLGTEGNDTIVAESPLFTPEFRTLNAGYDPAEASRLLDEIGLTERNGAGIRLLPDGRELEIIVETDGESRHRRRRR